MRNAPAPGASPERGGSGLMMQPMRKKCVKTDTKNGVKNEKAIRKEQEM